MYSFFYNVLENTFIGIVSGIIAGYLANHLFLKSKQKQARKFYKQHTGSFEESNKIKREKSDWSHISIELVENTKLQVTLKNGESNNASMTLEGTLDMASSFKATYVHHKNGLELWGHYEIHLIDSSRYVGTAYYEKDGKMLYRSIEWKRKS